MNIQKVIYHSEATLFNKLRRVPLKGVNAGVMPYYDSEFSIECLQPQDIAFCQKYVLKDNLSAIDELINDLQDMGIDYNSLRGYLTIETDKDVFDFLPPIVEVGNDGLAILNDGMHRVYTLSELHACNFINTIIIENVNPDYPYYAYPNDMSWFDVPQVNKKPTGSENKNYRIADYKSLFRDFNRVFINVTRERR